MGKTPSIPNPGKVAAQGIQTSTELQPYNYLIQSASTLGVPITLNGKTYDFSGLGQADTTGKVSDQMAQTLLDIQKTTNPTLIQQRIDELKAADPTGYAARKQLFDRIVADANSHPGRPLASDLQQTVQNELAKGAGFNDQRQLQQVQDQVRGQEVANGIYRGAAPTTKEAATVTNAGESLRSQREQNALQLLESGAAPEDVAYRKMQQSLANLGNFQAGVTPTAQFKQVSGASNVTPPGFLPTSGFEPNAAAQGAQNALGVFQGQSMYNQNQANPWLAGLGTLGATANSLYNNGAFSAGGIFGGSPTYQMNQSLQPTGQYLGAG